MEINKIIKIEVVYANAIDQVLMEMKINILDNILNIVSESFILNQFPEINLNINKVGIWNKACSIYTKLKNRDRIEIYFPLIVNLRTIKMNRVILNKFNCH